MPFSVIKTPYRGQKKFVGSVDPYWSNVVLAMHMDGTNGSTNFTDIKGHTASIAYGSPSISTSQSKFGGSSGYFNTAKIQFPDSPDWDVSGDVTIEGWIYATAISGIANVLMGQWQSGQFSSSAWVIEADGGYLNFYVATGSTRYNTGHPTLINTNTWYHFAATKSGSSIKIYLNGVGGPTVNLPQAANTSSYPLQIGTCTGAETVSWNGYIDDLRITKGVVRYTSNFSVPTGSFPEL